MRVIGIGNSCCDTLIEVDTLPHAGGKAMIVGTERQAGGQIAGAMAGCARLGMEAVYLLRTGDDADGELQRNALATAGVDLTYSQRVVGVPSATAFILRDGSGERIVLWRTDAGLAVRADDVPAELFDGAAAVIFDGKDASACLRAAALAHERQVPVVADLDCVYAHTAHLLPAIDHLIVPRSFPCPEPRLGQVVVVTDGARGATAHTPAGTLHVPAFPVRVTDSTGAGDAYHAGYIYGLAAGYDLRRRMQFAAATAALACTAVGAQAALPSLAEVEAALAHA